VPRRARIEGAGLIHHVTGHSVRGADAFPDDAARRGFLTLLASAVASLQWHVFAYCLVPTHYHLLLQTEAPNLGPGMRRLHGLHAQRLNHRHGRAGPLWRDRFHSRVVASGEYLLRAAVYIDTNPVAAGLCSAPEDWRWSSYRANAGLCEPPFWHRRDRLYLNVGAPPLEAPAVYRRMVELSVDALRARGLAPQGPVPRDPRDKATLRWGQSPTGTDP
jgi:REP element-mobilizing transposase RayT